MTDRERRAPVFRLWSDEYHDLMIALSLAIDGAENANDDGTCTEMIKAFQKIRCVLARQGAKYKFDPQTIDTAH